MSFSPTYPYDGRPTWPEITDKSSTENMSADDNMPAHLLYPKCKVCQGKSTGVHYGVQSCEGCKAFFKRGIVKRASYKCYFGRSCAITPKTRGRCKACRLQKCIDEGMSLEGSKTGRNSKIKENGNNREFAVQSQMSPESPATNSNTSNGDVRDPLPTNPTRRVSSSVLPAGTFALPTSSAVLSHTSVIKCARTMRNDLEHAGIVRSVSRTEEGRDSVIAGVIKKREPETLGSFLELTLVLRGSVMERTLPPGLRTRIVLDGDTDSSSFMMKYWSILKERNGCLEISINAVTEAVKSVYLDQIESWTSFMTNSLTVGHTPAQPETTLETMLDQWQGDVYDEVERSVRFAAMIPGFGDLPQGDQIRRICERGFHIWVVRHASFIRDNEMYALTAKDKFHYGRYWMDILLEKSFTDYIYDLAGHFNDLNLSLTETYLFLAAALFWPDASERHKATYSNLLYAHYLDALVNLVGSRKCAVLEKIHHIVNQFGAMKEIQANYCLAMDVNTVPFRLRSGIPFDCLRKAISAD